MPLLPNPFFPKGFSLVAKKLSKESTSSNVGNCLIKRWNRKSIDQEVNLLVYWLARDIVPSQFEDSLKKKKVFTIVVDLHKGSPHALAAIVTANLYYDMGVITTLGAVKWSL